MLFFMMFILFSFVDGFASGDYMNAQNSKLITELNQIMEHIRASDPSEFIDHMSPLFIRERDQRKIAKRVAQHFYSDKENANIFITKYGANYFFDKHSVHNIKILISNYLDACVISHERSYSWDSQDDQVNKVAKTELPLIVYNLKSSRSERCVKLPENQSPRSDSSSTRSRSVSDSTTGSLPSLVYDRVLSLYYFSCTKK